MMRRFVALLLAGTMLLSLSTIASAETTSYFADFPIPSAVDGSQGVKHLVEKGIIAGKGDNLFKPNDPILREEAAKIIVLAAEAPISSKKGSFSDAVAGSWYEEYIESSNESGLMQGIGDGMFGVGRHITKQDASLLIVRLAEYKGILIEKIADYSIKDEEDIAPYARDAVHSLVNMNVADLVKSEFLPENEITRLEFCQFIDRMLISDVNMYDDHVQALIPVEKSLDEYDTLELGSVDFENGINSPMTEKVSWSTGEVASSYIENGAGKDSNCAIKVSAADGLVHLFLEGIDPSAEYFYSFDVRTEGLGGGSNGSGPLFRTNYEFYDGNGKSVGGSYDRMGDIYENVDWTSVSFSNTAPTPDTMPKSLRISFGFRNTTTATAYVDNVKVYKMMYTPILSVLESPNYKGLIYEENGENDIRLTTYLKGLGSMYDPEKSVLKVNIADFEGNVKTETLQEGVAEEMSVSLSSKVLDIGDYDLGVYFYDAESGEQHGEAHWTLRKREPDYRPKYYFDENKRVMKDKEPYFGIGVYALGLTPPVISDLENTNGAVDFMISNSTSLYWSNRDLLDEIGEKDISSMISTEAIFKDSIRGEYQNSDVTTIASERPILERLVNNLKLTDSKGHWGYQLNNESPFGKWADRMRWHNEILSELDIDHMTYGVGAGGRDEVLAFTGSHDIYAADPYPIYGGEDDPIWEIYRVSKQMNDDTPNRPYYMVLQISDLRVMGGNYITRYFRGPYEEELRNMAWQSICGGAAGIIWYAHFHLERYQVVEDYGLKPAMRPKEETWGECVRVSNELRTFEDVILSAEEAPEVQVLADVPDRFCHTVRRYDGKTYVILTNTSKDSQMATVKIDNAKSAVGAYSNSSYDIIDDTIEVNLSGLGVEVLIIDQPDSLSTDAELTNMHFADKEKDLFISKNGEEAVLDLGEDVTGIFYNADINPKAQLFVNGEIAAADGIVCTEGKDELVFTVVSEDGKHKNEYRYKLFRHPQEM